MSKKVPHKEWVSNLSALVNVTITEIMTSLSEDVELFEMTESNKRVIERVVVDKMKTFSKKMYTFLEENGNPRKQRVSRDEEAPKRAETAYMCFCRINRKDYKSKNPNLDNADVTRLLSSDWKKMKEADKQAYVSMSLDDKSRFDVEMKQYKEEIEKEEKEPKKKISRPNLIFYSEHREEMKRQFPELKFPAITKKLAEKWNALSSEKKDEYKKQAEINKKENSSLSSSSSSYESSSSSEDENDENNDENNEENNENKKKKEDKTKDKTKDKSKDKSKDKTDKTDEEIKKNVKKIIDKMEKTKASTVKTMQKKMNKHKDDIKELCPENMFSSFSEKIEKIIKQKIDDASLIEKNKKVSKTKNKKEEKTEEKKTEDDEEDNEDDD